MAAKCFDIRIKYHVSDCPHNIPDKTIILETPEGDYQFSIEDFDSMLNRVRRDFERANNAT